MSDSVKEQLSACLDGQLADGELDLLLKRVEREPELRQALGRYALITEAMRPGNPTRASGAFADGVMAALDAEPASAKRYALSPRTIRWLRPAAGFAVAAGVAAVAVLVLQPETG